MAKPDGLPDHDWELNELMRNSDDDPRFNNPAVHEIHRGIRKVMDEFPEAMTVGEIWVKDNQKFGEYIRPDERHLGFNFRLAETEFSAESVREAVENSLAAVAEVGGVPTWTLSNHDVEREVTRYGGGEIGTQRARAMILVELALPGASFIYNGAELGLPNVDLPDDALQDPVWERSGHAERGRDGCRVPLPWEGSEPPFGFTTGASTWLPMPAEWSTLTVEAQIEDVDSMLSLYRAALELRSARPEFSGTDIDWYGSPPGCLAFRRRGGLICALNTTEVPIALPSGQLLLSSAPLVDGQLPVNAAAWLI